MPKYNSETDLSESSPQPFSTIKCLKEAIPYLKNKKTLLQLVQNQPKLSTMVNEKTRENLLHLCKLSFPLSSLLSGQGHIALEFKRHRG
jgi:hypothetical protein